MTLEQSSAFRPFVRQLTTLMHIAFRASYHDIRRLVRSSATQWDNVINVEFIANFFVAVVALPALAFVLRDHIYAFVARRIHQQSSDTPTTLDCVAHGASLERSYVFYPTLAYAVAMLAIIPSVVPAKISPFLRSIPTVCGAHLLWMLVFPSSAIFAVWFRVLLPLLLVLSSYLIAPLSPSSLIVFVFMLLPCWIISLFLSGGIFTSLAIRIEAIASRFVLREIRDWLLLPTTQADFCRGIHSASLSLYLRKMPAGGEIIRSSGATLADFFIIPRKAAI